MKKINAVIALSVLTLALDLVHADTRQQTSPLAQLKTLAGLHEPTRVMVLGVFHFRELDDRFRPSMVQSLIAKLHGFKPDIVAVENMSGARIHELELRREASAIHPELLDSFAATSLELGHVAQKTLDMDMIQAARAVAAAQWQDSPPTLRQRTLLNLAAYEWPDALLCWSYLSAEERHGDGRFPDDLAETLNAQLTRVTELQQLALPLARSLGHRQIAAVDEFEDPIACEALLNADVFRRRSPLFKEAQAAAVYQESGRRREQAVLAGDLLPVIRYLNSPEYAAGDVAAQWGVLLRTCLDDDSDRSRLALWENRNLKIAANIRALASRHPGKRILVIYGSAHKPFLEECLKLCSDIELIRFSDICR